MLALGLVVEGGDDLVWAADREIDFMTVPRSRPG
jgi:hypothetical protein